MLVALPSSAPSHRWVWDTIHLWIHVSYYTLRLSTIFEAATEEGRQTRKIIEDEV